MRFIFLLILFFFSCSGRLRDLHSFPTRRSSDLGGWSSAAMAFGASGKPSCGRRGTGFHGSNGRDRKSTRLNSSHGSISYAVFCLKKKIIAIITLRGSSNRDGIRGLHRALLEDVA